MGSFPRRVVAGLDPSARFRLSDRGRRAGFAVWRNSGHAGHLRDTWRPIFPKRVCSFRAVPLSAQSHVLGRRHPYDWTRIVRVVSIHPSARCGSVSFSTSDGRIRGRARPGKEIWRKLSCLQTLGESMVAKIQRQQILTHVLSSEALSCNPCLAIHVVQSMSYNKRLPKYQ